MARYTGTAAPRTATSTSTSTQPFDVREKVLPSWLRTHKALVESGNDLKRMQKTVVDAATTVKTLPDSKTKESLTKMLASLRTDIKDQVEDKEAEINVSAACCKRFKKQSVVPGGDSGYAFLAKFLQVLPAAKQKMTVKELMDAFTQNAASVEAREAAHNPSKKVPDESDSDDDVVAPRSNNVSNKKNGRKTRVVDDSEDEVEELAAPKPKDVSFKKVSKKAPAQQESGSEEEKVAAQKSKGAPAAKVYLSRKEKPDSKLTF